MKHFKLNYYRFERWKKFHVKQLLNNSAVNFIQKNTVVPRETFSDIPCIDSGKSKLKVIRLIE